MAVMNGKPLNVRNVNDLLKSFAVKALTAFHNKTLKAVMIGLIFSYGG